ncbi:PAS domain S-box protein, partial [Candidatus Sumerlaeota bacterium]|nr:PAS domain S-box protein [Candidatus Sumerlaeota bacterium]
GPTMTSIVRNATQTGNLDEENVYNYLANEVDNAIHELKNIAPDSRIRDIVDQIGEANDRLVETEKKSLDLVRQGRLEDASALVYSQKYRDDINNFDTYNYNLSEALRAKVEQEVYSLRTRAFFAVAIILGSIPVLIFVWMVVLGLVRRHLIQQSHQESVNAIFASLEHKLSSVSTPNEVALEVLHAADELFGWDSSYLVLYQKDRDNFKSVVNFDVMDGVRQKVQSPGASKERAFFLRLVLEKGPQLILRKNSEDDTKYNIIPFGDKSHRSSSLMFVPVRKADRNVGVLSIQSYSSYMYDHSDLELFQVLADHCSGALDRTMAETRLLQSEENLRLLTEQIPALLWTTDNDLRFTLLRGAGLRDLKIDPAQFIGKTLHDFFTDKNAPLFPVAIHKGALHGNPSNYEMELMGKYFDSYVEPLQDIQGKIIGCVCVAHDITERIRAEEELRRAHEDLEKRVEERTRELSLSNALLRQEIAERKRAQQDLAHSEAIYREAIENASGVPYRFLYGQESYEFMGKEIYSITGYSPEEFNFAILRKCVQETVILDPDAPQNHLEYIEAFRRGELDQYRVDLRIKTRDGEQKWISDCSVPIRDEATGKVIGSLGILQDITKRKQVEEQARIQQERLIQADKMVSLGILVSGVAHEINNPNNFIMLNTPILLESWESAKPVLEQYYHDHGDFVMGGLNYSEMRNHIPILFAGIVEGSKRIKNIVQELRDFARQYPAELKENIKINDVVNSALTLLSNMIKKSTDYFYAHCEDDLPPLKGNFQRLEQVIINLIQNACQALPDRRKAIHVYTSFDQDANSIIVKVQDEGVGIHPEKMKYITDPFFTTKRDSGGTGLGLSISANIVDEHGGKLLFDSELDKGTAVSVILPLNMNNPSDTDLLRNILAV